MTLPKMTDMPPGDCSKLAYALGAIPLICGRNVSRNFDTWDSKIWTASSRDELFWIASAATWLMVKPE
jgi:hypothetical protein